MLIPKSLYIKNFLSFEEESIEFKNGVTTCIMGRNLTEDNQKSNGSGKSAFQAAVELSYTGSVSRKVTKNKLIRRGCTEAEVIHEVFNNVKNETLKIRRILPLKGSEKLEVFLNNVQVDLPTVRDGNNWIEEYIGISREDISNYFIPNEVNYVSFFSSPDTKKKELISRFSNADIVDPVFSRVQVDIDNVRQEIINTERDSLKTETRIEQLREDLVREQERDFEAEKTEEIGFVNASIIKSRNKITEYKERLVVINEDLHNTNTVTIPKKKSSLNELKQEINKFSIDTLKESLELKEETLSSINEKIKKAKTASDELKDDLREINEDISSMQLVLRGKIECPKCKHEFNPTSKVSIEEATKKIEQFQEELVETNDSLVSVSKLIEKYSEQKRKSDEDISSIESEISFTIRKKREFEQRLETINSEITREERNIKRLKEEIEEINSSIEHENSLIEQYSKRIQEIKNSVKDNRRELELEESIKSLENDHKKIEQSIQELSTKEELVKEWIINFKLFKSYLANKKLKIIQDIINKYLTEMGCGYKLKLEGYKQLASGELREKITPYIYQDGELCDYGEFSKGERVRIDYATLLTLQALVNDNCEKGGLDLIFADEIGEGLDELGLQSVLESFNLTKKTSFITTHVTSDTLYENIMMIEKRSGISSVVKN